MANPVEFITYMLNFFFLCNRKNESQHVFLFSVVEQ